MSESADRLKAFIDSDFLLKLEFHLSKSLKDFLDDNVKCFWCDGLLIEEKIDTALTIEVEKRITAKAWIGSDGQDIYKMFITLGQNPFKSYLDKKDLDYYLPENNVSNWLSIQPKDKTLEVRLD
jgi:hypothetical protein